jgi:undecaprenyl diphosphate synthase
MIPTHISIIPDGNRRWAKREGLKRLLAHNTSGNYQNLIKLCKEVKDLGIQYLSIWAFSTENWKRDPREIREIFDVINRGLDLFIQDASKNKYRFRHIGRKDKLPKKMLERINRLERETSGYTQFNLLLGIDYGGRDELIRAINSIVSQGIREIDEGVIRQNLDTSGIPDPDLIIRTGGEKRLSGFMPFQATYSEFYFTELLFPDFTPKNLKEAVEEYSKRKRRFGGN